MLKADKHYFTLNGKSFYLYSGEIHYFRIKPVEWDAHLKRAIEAGLNTVSTYIPWSWHEYEEGKFDFEGSTHPQRNLIGYLKKVQDAGLYLSVRIGPFSNAELKGEGLPEWLLDNYPEIYSLGEGITNLPHAILVSYINTTFRNFIRKWYDKLIPHIVTYDAVNGGNIILLQLCNEIGMIHWINRHGDYTACATQMYQEYLKDKYKNISALMEVYPDSEFKEFEEIKQTYKRKVYGWQDLSDIADFYRHYFADYYKFLYLLAREKGVNTSVIANIPQFIDFDVRGRGLSSPMTTSFYKYIPEKVENIVFGGAYQMRRLDYENFHDVFITTQVVKSLTDYNNPVICAELQSGIMRDRPRLYSSDVELNLKTSLAAGVDGVNCYMFSGGENPEGIGVFGKYHKWQAPVGTDGAVKKHFNTIKEHGEFLKTFGEIIARTTPFFQTNVGIYPPYYATEFLDNKDSKALTDARDRYFFDGVARLLNLSNFNFKVIDLIKDDLNPRKVETLWVFSQLWMDKEIQDKLVRYVRNGGRLVIFPELPENDLSGKRCTKIADEMGVNILGRVRKSTNGSGPSVVLFNGIECYNEGEVTTVELSTGSGPSAFKVLAVVGDKICALSKKLDKGKFIFIGLGLPHYYDYQVNIISGIAENELGIRKNIYITPDDILGFLRCSDSGSFLFLMNYHDDDYKVKIKLNISEPELFLVEENIQISRRSAKILPLNIKISEDIRILYTTAEVLSYKIGGMSTAGGSVVEFKLKGVPGEEVKINLKVCGKERKITHKLKEEIEFVAV